MELVRTGERLVTSAEVMQEILHRYVAIGRRDAIGPASRVLDEICDEVLDITRNDVEAAREIVQKDLRFTARDALHVAVMRRHSVETILSFDRAFDFFDDLQRIGPT
jgi:predicted nucleic acid-binding protein